MENNNQNESNEWFIEYVKSHPNSKALQKKQDEIMQTAEVNQEQDKKDGYF